MLAEARDALYQTEAIAIHNFQESFGRSGSFLNKISLLGDPSMGFIFYFPLIFALNKDKGIRFLKTFIFSEWVNQVLKWILHGDRPYWWVKETQQNIILEENFLTCETGPGLPSGHCQASFVICYCLVDALTEGQKKNSRTLSLLCIFLPMQALMLCSRIYISAHFPHQCIAGFACAALCIRWVYTAAENSTSAENRLHSVLRGLTLPLSALLIYLGLLLSGFNPNWSLDLATKWCKESKWVYLDTTPFYAMIRYSGAALGLACCAGNSKFLDYPGKLLPLLTGIGCGVATNAVHKGLPRDSMYLFYSVELFVNFSSVLLIILLPYTIHKMSLPKLK